MNTDITDKIADILCDYFRDPIDTECPYCAASQKIMELFKKEGRLIEFKDGDTLQIPAKGNGKVWVVIIPDEEVKPGD